MDAQYQAAVQELQGLIRQAGIEHETCRRPHHDIRRDKEWRHRGCIGILLSGGGVLLLNDGRSSMWGGAKRDWMHTELTRIANVVTGDEVVVLLREEFVPNSYVIPADRVQSETAWIIRAGMAPQDVTRWSMVDRERLLHEPLSDLPHEVARRALVALYWRAGLRTHEPQTCGDPLFTNSLGGIVMPNGECLVVSSRDFSLEGDLAPLSKIIDQKGQTLVIFHEGTGLRFQSRGVINGVETAVISRELLLKEAACVIKRNAVVLIGELGLPGSLSLPRELVESVIGQPSKC